MAHFLKLAGRNKILNSGDGGRVVLVSGPEEIVTTCGANARWGCESLRLLTPFGARIQADEGFRSKT